MHKHQKILHLILDNGICSASHLCTYQIFIKCYVILIILGLGNRNENCVFLFRVLLILYGRLKSKQYFQRLTEPCYEENP
jgi:hypothetical protein